MKEILIVSNGQAIPLSEYKKEKEKELRKESFPYKFKVEGFIPEKK